LIAAFYLPRWVHSLGETNLTVLPLNGGHAVYVDSAGRNNDWLVDCGNSDAVNFTLTPFLRAQGVNKIPRLVLTEGDAKNCGGADTLDNLFGIGELWTSQARFRSPVYNKIIASCEKSPSRRRIFDYGSVTGCWQVLWPPAPNDFSRADDNALVLLGNFCGTKVLLLSDLSLAGQSGLLSSTNDLHANIVIAGLPNEGQPLGDSLADAIQPQLIIIADSDFPATRRATHELKDRLAQRQIPVIYTRQSGAATIVINKTGWRAQTMDGQKFASPP